MDLDTVVELLPEASREALSRRGVDVDDPTQVGWAASVGAVTHLLRHSVREDWHDQLGGLDGPDMLRDSAALTRQVHRMLDSGDLPDWHRVATVLTPPHRLLPDGRAPGRYARSERALHELTAHAIGLADVLSSLSGRDPQLALLYVAMQVCRSSSEQWWGMPAWPRRVEIFLGVQPSTVSLPEDVSSLADLHRSLLAGPDRLTRESAVWCLGHGLDGSVVPLPIPVSADWVPDR